MQRTLTASNVDFPSTPGARSAKQPRPWSRRVVAGLALAMLAGVLSLASTSPAAEAAGPDEIVVRAAGATGQEEMLLRVNGKDVKRWRVAKGAAGYSYSVTSPLDVSTLEVAFINDDGPRDLTVDTVNVGGVVLKSTDPSTISTGTHVAADGGCKSRPSVSPKLHCNGSFTYAVPDGTVLGRATATSGPAIAVRVVGVSGSEQMQVRINGSVVASATVGTSWQVVRASLPEGTKVTSAEVQFVNDGQGRDLRVDYLEVDGQKYQSESSDTLSNGTHADGSCRERSSRSEWLHCSGWFRYAVSGAPAAAKPAPSPAKAEPEAPAPMAAPVEPAKTEEGVKPAPPEPTGDAVVIRALGRSGSEVMQLRIDGRAVKSWEVSKSWATYEVTVPDASAISSLEVQFVNDASGRDLRVDYVELDGAKYQSESSTTLAKGTHNGSSCAKRTSTSEWLHCSGWFRYPVNGSTVVADEAPAPSAAAPTGARVVSSPTPATTARSGRYSIAQVIDGTIGAGDGSNPNEESPMGRHEAPLYLPQGWNWAQGPTRNSVWGQLGTGGSRYAEWRCAVIPENGHRPSVPFRINVKNGAYYQFVNNSWNKAFNVDLTGGNHGGYLGQAGRTNNDPFSSGGHGQIQWRRESDGSYSAPWNSNALMMHFWAGKRQAPASGQTAEFLTSEVRLQQPDGRTVDLSKVKVLFQCGIDYYNTTGGQGTKVPGPGIAKYHRVTKDWRPGLWVTLPRNAPAGSVGDFRSWLERNPPPNVSR